MEALAPPDPRGIARRFQLESEVQWARPYGNGHINATFLVACGEPGGERRYLLQRINAHVFCDPPALMENLGRVTRHVRARLAGEGVEDLGRRALALVPSEDGADFVRDEDGDYWRCFPFIEGTRTLAKVESAAQAFEAARAYGAFQRLLSDLPPPSLVPTIPHFHDAGMRFRAFHAVLDQDLHHRATQAVPEIRFALENRALAEFFAGFIARGEMGERIVHNDTKLDNLLFDATADEALCVVDLDTVMPGLPLYDFGDLARSAACGAVEDEFRLDKVFVEPTLFGALAKGFLEGSGDGLNAAERENLVGATQVFAYTLGLRFLTDFLEGDRYFRIRREGHNLDRARVQFALLRDLQAREDELRAAATR